MGTNILGMSDKVFWKCTPKKLEGLWQQHKYTNGIEDEEKEEYIDNILF